MDKYRWASPREWLDWKRQTSGISDTEILNTILDEFDGDQLQDAFQAEMCADGYFTRKDDG